MSGDHLRRPLILLLLVGGCCAVLKKPIIQALYDGDTLNVHLSKSDDLYVEQITIAPSSNVTLNITNVSSSTSFIIAQVHAYQYKVTLSYDKDHLHVISNRSVFGSNIGLHIPMNPSVVITHLYLENDNVHTVHAVIAAVAYNNRAPIPGGCNMEFNTEIAPYAKVQLDNTMIIVDTQPASIPANKLACDKNPVQHKMYQMYLTEQDYSVGSYMTGIINMLTVEDILQNGNEVPDSTILPPMRKIFNAYTGTGSVYVTVATYNNVSAAYIPTFSQGCNPLVDPDSCQVLTSAFQKFVCACCFFTGFLSLLLGPRCPNIDQGVPVLFVGTAVTYIFILNIGWALLCGLAVVIIWGITDFFHQFINKILFNISLGFFVACVTYFMAPDSLASIHNNEAFWLLFVTLVVITSVLTLMFSNFTSMITCTIYSTFMMVLPLDYYFGSCLKYMIINVIRRATVEGFNNAIVSHPIQAIDITLISVWVILALYGLYRQITLGMSSAESLSHRSYVTL
ncbi:transmembrane 7 superfamily member 3 [Nomia melanderi]|uniref:transmembrane 7 superfamily member 3 n=1 Tax=Nomia melanderi TaxID=2448451 RepID=UPI0013041785|nr:transmembrane 7 superfamily member 3-like [Nomia melanderi]